MSYPFWSLVNTQTQSVHMELGENRGNERPHSCRSKSSSELTRCLEFDIELMFGCLHIDFVRLAVNIVSNALSIDIVYIYVFISILINATHICFYYISKLINLMLLVHVFLIHLYCFFFVLRFYDQNLF